MDGTLLQDSSLHTPEDFFQSGQTGQGVFPSGSLYKGKRRTVKC